MQYNPNATQQTQVRRVLYRTMCTKTLIGVDVGKDLYRDRSRRKAAVFRKSCYILKLKIQHSTVTGRLCGIYSDLKAYSFTLLGSGHVSCISCQLTSLHLDLGQLVLHLPSALKNWFSLNWCCMNYITYNIVKLLNCTDLNVGWFQNTKFAILDLIKVSFLIF